MAGWQHCWPRATLGLLFHSVPRKGWALISFFCRLSEWLWQAEVAWLDVTTILTTVLEVEAAKKKKFKFYLKHIMLTYIYCRGHAPRFPEQGLQSKNIPSSAGESPCAVLYKDIPLVVVYLVLKIQFSKLTCVCQHQVGNYP